MTIAFYHGHGSPYSWRVWLALEHQQLPYDLRALSFSAKDTHKPEFLELNPRHKVPVIVDADLVLYESAAIIEYLDERYYSVDESRALLPHDLKARALARRLIREIDQYFGGAMSMLVRQILFTPETGPDPREIQNGHQGCVDELGFLERQLRGDYFMGKLSAVDFTLYPMLGLCLRMEKRNPQAAIAAAIGPNLRAWMQRIEALPYYRKTYPPHWT
jgi:glutathione S-transferase